MSWLRPALFALWLAFSVTLAVVIGLRLSDQAMAVIVGVIAGVAASIPTSLIVVWLATRSAPGSLARRERPAEPDPEPRVIVVAPPYPPAAAPLPDPRAAGPASAAPERRRSFTVIGGDDD